MIKQSQMNMWLVKCIYCKPTQEDLIQDIIDNSIKSVQSNTATISASEKFADNAIVHLMHCAPMLKHPKFKEEEEWRLIQKITSNKKLCVRISGGTGFVPYTPINFCPKAIGDIIISPCADKGFARTSTLAACAYNDILFDDNKGKQDRSLSNSEIPYRNW